MFNQDSQEASPGKNTNKFALDKNATIDSMNAGLGYNGLNRHESLGFINKKNVPQAMV